MWATTSTVKAFHEYRHNPRRLNRRRNQAQRLQRDAMPLALGRTVTAR